MRQATLIIFVFSFILIYFFMLIVNSFYNINKDVEYCETIQEIELDFLKDRIANVEEIINFKKSNINTQSEFLALEFLYHKNEINNKIELLERKLDIIEQKADIILLKP